MTRLGWPLLVLLVLAGCDAADGLCEGCDAGVDRPGDGGGATDGGGTTDGGAPDASAPDGGVDGGLDAGIDAGPSLPLGCQLSGVRLGARYRFRTVTDTSTSESTSEITEWTQTGDSVSYTSESTGSNRGDGYEQTHTSIGHTRCDETGSYAISSETSGTTRRDGVSTPFSTRTTYRPEFRTMVAELSVGQTWTSRQAGSTVSAGMTTPFDNSWRYRVAREGRRTVGAGTFDAFEIEVTQVGGMGAWSFWFAPGVGTIETGPSELVELR